MQDVRDPTSSSAVTDAVLRRRWPIRLSIGLVLIVTLTIAFAVWHDRLEFAYEGPDGTVAPGGQVTIRDPDGECGPLLVSIWEPSVLGQWNRTHSGNAFGNSFTRDAHPWWKLWDTGTTYFTPVPCRLNGEMSFTLPRDVESGTIAVCDMDQRCAKLEVA